MRETQKQVQKSANLNMIRGLAALGVCAGHLRAAMFLDSTTLNKDDLLGQLFYFTTGLGHQAVIVFFVLSGYFVGGPALHRILKNRWSWPDYLSRRLTRLWVVLIPALALTWAWDAAGRELTGGIGYDGLYYNIMQSGPSQEMPARSDLITLLGNLFFCRQSQLVHSAPMDPCGVWQTSFGIMLRSRLQPFA